jgi:sugar O-acyltransferase (sialic acid O-acetyltransferase NeuD family)
MEPLVIVGAGGFGREVLWLVEEINAANPTWEVLGFLDDLQPAHHASDGPPFLGPVAAYGQLGSPRAVCAIGSPRVRMAKVQRLEEMGVRWATLIHPRASVSRRARIDEGSIICHAASVSVEARIGRHAHLNHGVLVAHDVVLGEACTLSPHADVNGAAVLEEGVFLGSHACVLPGARVGAWATVGAGSVVLSNVAANTTVFGVPARQVPAVTPPTPPRP